MDFSVSFGGIETIDYYIIGSPSISIFNILNILLQSHDVRRHPFKRYPRLGRDKNSQQRTELTKSCLFQRRRSSEILSLGLFRTQYSLARFFLDILGYFELTPSTYWKHFCTTLSDFFKMLMDRFFSFLIGSPSITSSSLAKLPSRVGSGLGKSRWIVGSCRTKMAAAIAGLSQAQNQGKQQGGVASERSLRSVFGTF